MRAVFGPSFVVLPRFTFDAATARPNSTSALAASTAAQGGDPLAANTWFARYARVRDGVAQLGRVPATRGGARHRRTAQPERRAAALRLGERWVGLPPRPAPRLAAEQAVARDAHGRAPQPDAGDDGPVGGRVGRDRAERARDHGDRVSVRRARFLRAAERADCGAAGARAGLDHGNVAARADGDARPREAARRGHRGRLVPRRSISRASTSRSTPRTTPCRPISLRSRTKRIVMPSPQLFVNITSPAGGLAARWTAPSRWRGNISWLFMPTNWSLVSKSVSVQFGPGGSDMSGDLRRQHAELGVQRDRRLHRRRGDRWSS